MIRRIGVAFVVVLGLLLVMGELDRQQNTQEVEYAKQ